MDQDTAVTCPKCGEVKPPAEFYATRSDCKACAREASRAWRAANLDRSRAAARERYKREEAQAYYQRNRDRINAQALQWQRSHPDERRDQKRWGRMKAAGVFADQTITTAAIFRRYGSRCFYCDVELDRERSAPFSALNRATIDHLTPISRGGAHVWDNVRPSCMQCNARKGRRTLSEFWQSKTAPRQEDEGPDEQLGIW